MRGQAAENDVGGVDHEPLALGFTGLRAVSARHSSAAFCSNGDVRESRSGRFDRSMPAITCGGGLTFAAPETGTKEQS
ncbi:hypothetical protein GCM10017576_07750 [Microbacterium barkeri]|uniref:Uncharacterized protein n=1 Tax=Microbacterium barkeri TaxID=33917 RepID=A0A9W6H121_9MICO|nr:hypothetical protein GCM10017576_07750 [Microbacterium barkeri]